MIKPSKGEDEVSEKVTIRTIENENNGVTELIVVIGDRVHSVFIGPDDKKIHVVRLLTFLAKQIDRDELIND